MALLKIKTASKHLCSLKIFVQAILILIIVGPESAARANTVAVPAGGDLQAAINAAQPGDTIIVQAGATYLGPFVLPNKAGNSYITIQSSRASEITGRVSPAQSDLLAKLQSNRPYAEQIIRTAPGAHHYKLIGLEVSTSTASIFVYDLMRFGAGDASQTDLASTPHDLILDRLWIHGFPTQDLQRGISLNSAETSIINSYISDIHGIATDTQGICGWNGPGPFHIINNYIEAGAENILFGGADPKIPGLVPSDIEIRGNYLFKPLSWKMDDPSYGGIHWTVKNLLELKNAQRVTIDGNVFENDWLDGQNGIPIVFTARNQDGTAPWSVVDSVVFTNNTVRNAQGGVIILRTDAESRGAITSNITIHNNVFDNIDGLNPFITLLNGPNNVSITHNTVFKAGNIATLDADPSSTKGNGLVVKDNLFSEGGYGFTGSGVGEGTAGIDKYFASYNYIRNNNAGRDGSMYPPGNTFVLTPAVGFVDYTNGDYRLAAGSPFKNGGTDGKDIGVDVDALLAAQSGSQLPPSPTPTPTPIPTATPTPTPTPTPIPPIGNPTDVVLWAANAPVKVGNWLVVSDASAAGGYRLSNPDAGAAKITTATANPSDYFEATFTAAAGIPYRLWMRSKAEGDSPYNDSVFAQFSGSVDSGGSAVHRIGTTSATAMNLEDCFGCGIQGWGWQDNGWSVLGPTIYFQSTGTQTIRVQVREDGLSIDQIVLSPVTYLSNSPGTLRNDTVILPSSTGPTPTPTPTPIPTPTPLPTPTPTPLPSAPADVVIWASNILSSAIHGAWFKEFNSTAAGQTVIRTADYGAAKVTNPGAPADYFEVSFNALAGVPYRLWLRGRAENDFWGNDSVYAQFSSSIDAGGAAVYRIDTGSALVINLEDCFGCGIQGWGWQETGWGVGVFGPVVYFQTTGQQTLRIQRREDGFLIDQILLSPGNYLNRSPGALTNDTVIFPSKP